MKKDQREREWNSLAPGNIIEVTAQFKFDLDSSNENSFWIVTNVAPGEDEIVITKSIIISKHEFKRKVSRLIHT